MNPCAASGTLLSACSPGWNPSRTEHFPSRAAPRRAHTLTFYVNAMYSGDLDPGRQSPGTMFSSVRSCFNASYSSMAAACSALLAFLSPAHLRSLTTLVQTDFYAIPCLMLWAPQLIWVIRVTFCMSYAAEVIEQSRSSTCTRQGCTSMNPVQLSREGEGRF